MKKEKTFKAAKPSGQKADVIPAENTLLSGYTKIEDAFIDRYLTRDGETVEEAKKRLKNEVTNG